MTDDPLWMSAIELRDAIAAKQLSAMEVCEAALARLEALEPQLNAFATLTPEVARNAAEQADLAIREGLHAPPLAGVPTSVKDLVAMADVPYMFGSRTMADNVAAVDAPSVERLRRAGAVILGKTTTPEFGCKGSGVSPLTGVTRNPWDTTKTPGGSSAGAAASVAAGVTPIAAGTDGGGSVRIPASFCGLFGIKAQYGRVPIYPAPATASVSHVGPLTRTVRDAAVMLGVMSGFDERDPFAVAAPVPDYLAACDAAPTGLKIAWSPTLGYADPDPEIVDICAAAVGQFEALGCTVEQVDDVFDDPYDIWFAEFLGIAGTFLRDAVANTPDLLDPALLELIEDMPSRPLVEYMAPALARHGFRDRVRLFFEDWDLLATPTLPVLPFDAEQNTPPQPEGKSMLAWVPYNFPFNLTGQPAASIPAGFSASGLPVGLQLVARINSETDIFRAAAAFEAAQPWIDRRPPVA